MSPTRPKPLSELAGEENVPEELRDSLLEVEEPEELEARHGISPDEYQELITSFQEVIDTSEINYLLLGSWGYEERQHMEAVRAILDEYPNVRAHLPIDLPTDIQQPSLVTLKLAADFVDHILFIIDSGQNESDWVALELGLLLEEYESKTDILLHEDVASRPLPFLVYESLMVFQGETRIHKWSTEDDLYRQINRVLLQHTDDVINEE